MIVTAVVKRIRSDDGIVGMPAHVQVGDRFQVILESRCIRRYANKALMRVVDREMIQDYDTRQWLPVELLDIQEG